MNKVTIEVDWITISEAAKLFGRTRAAIEQHIKTGRVEAKRFGDKQFMFTNQLCKVSLPLLQSQLAQKNKLNWNKLIY